MSNAKLWRGREPGEPPPGRYGPPLVLLGMPGAGKTTLGRALAAHYDWEFVDLDAEIERRAGHSIAELFVAEYESGFRKREAATLRAVLGGHPAPLVLATGGGTPCFEHNMEFLKSRSFTVWLDAPDDTLIDRLAADVDSRPLLKGADSRVLLELRLILLAMDRRRFYRQAHLRTAAQTPETLLAALAAVGFGPPAGTRAAEGA